MKPGVLALDYDGTVAVHGVLDAGVRAALEEARGGGMSVLLVTGRILADLERLLGELSRLFDAVVAENGAVLHFPRSGRSMLLAPPPPASFLDELRHREIPFLAGEVVVEADAERAGAILAAIREMRLPLVMLFNGGRLMVLPQAVSKATGLREALRALRLSAHNAVGIGDAENDHELLAACELGVAVAWGSPILVAAADEVIAGDGPPAVAGYLRSLLRRPRIAAPRLTKRKVHLGVRESGEELALAMRGRNVLIAGDTRSGKSWLAGLLCEQLVLQHYCLCVIDPEGEHTAMEALPSVVVFDASPAPPELDDLERAVRYPDVSVVVDLSQLEHERKTAYVHDLLERLRSLRRTCGLPHRIVLDEAHYFLGEARASELLDPELDGYTLVTWNASRLHPDVVASASAVVVTRVSDPAEAQALHKTHGRGADLAAWSAALSGLRLNEAALLPGAEESGDSLVRFRLSGRLTQHVRHERKYLRALVPPDQSFVFAGRGGASARRARSLAEVASLLPSVEDLGAYLHRRDLSRWIAEVVGDAEAAARVRGVEDRWSAGTLEHPAAALARAVRGVVADESPPGLGGDGGRRPAEARPGEIR